MVACLTPADGCDLTACPGLCTALRTCTRGVACRFYQHQEGSSLAVQGPTLQAMTDLKIGHPAPKLSRARTMELYERNSWLTRSTSDTSVTMRLDGPHPLRMARMASTHFQQGRATEETPDQRWFKTTATSFAKYGIYPGQGLKGMYMRDPHTGVWFKDTPERLWHKELEKPQPSSVSKSNKDFVPLYALHVHLHCKP